MSDHALSSFNHVMCRVAYVPPPSYGDQESAKRYEEEVARALAKQQVRYAVAPRASVDSLTRGRLTAGEEITPSDVGHSPSWSFLLDRAIVLAIPEFVLAARKTSPDARYVVAEGGSIVSLTRGVLAPGIEVTPEDLATPAVAARAAVAAHVSPIGAVVPEQPAHPGRPCSDGTAELAEFVRRGVVVDRHANRNAQAKRSARE